MNPDFLSIADMLVNNGILIWLGLRLIKRVDQLDTRVDNHETRITLAERDIEYSKQGGQ